MVDNNVNTKNSERKFLLSLLVHFSHEPSEGLQRKQVFVEWRVGEARFPTQSADDDPHVQNKVQRTLFRNHAVQNLRA